MKTVAEFPAYRPGSINRRNAKFYMETIICAEEPSSHCNPFAEVKWLLTRLGHTEAGIKSAIAACCAARK